ncbi:hypothetical protein OSB04_031639 [Centaurea solstitialis]|uniref:FAR1 domain-containing protein n=1 Tax=Centaurea solstitialis TaxID=347529 RepID=A0AA38SN10_9ASTR|nr:hypothetical protein OSB04_031639 [Centaurea solstitialis]
MDGDGVDVQQGKSIVHTDVDDRQRTSMMDLLTRGDLDDVEDDINDSLDEFFEPEEDDFNGEDDVVVDEFDDEEYVNAVFMFHVISMVVSPGGSKYWIPHVPDGFYVTVGMIFETLDAAEGHYVRYAQSAGFDVRRANKKTNKLGDVQTRFLVCSKEGAPLNKSLDTLNIQTGDRKRRNSNVKRQGCKAWISLGPMWSGIPLPKKRGSSTNIGPSTLHKMEVHLKGGYQYVGPTSIDYHNARRDVASFVGNKDAKMLALHDTPFGNRGIQEHAQRITKTRFPIEDPILNHTDTIKGVSVDYLCANNNSESQAGGTPLLAPVERVARPPLRITRKAKRKPFLLLVLAPVLGRGREREFFEFFQL